MNIFGLGLQAAAAAMLGLGGAISDFARLVVPRRAPQVRRDGVRRGRRAPGGDRQAKKRRHPDHLASRRTQAWRDFAARVVATHSDRPDPRDDKYLHAWARQYRIWGRLAGRE